MKTLFHLFLLAFAGVTSLRAEKLVLVAGGGSAETDGPATECRLREPFGAEFAPDGTMWIVEMASSNRLLKLEPGGLLRHLAGGGKPDFAGDAGPVNGARFNGMHNLAIAPSGDVYLADTWNYRVRKIGAKTGIIETIAGTGKKSFSGDDGPAIAAWFGSIIQIALDAPAENLYIADIDNRRIRRIKLATRVVETVAGTGEKGVPADGADAKWAPLIDPRAVVPNPEGGFYILERSGHALRAVDGAGKIRTVVGTGKPGLNGDNGPGVSATLNGPKHLCLDRDGSVLIADAENHVIRRYDPRTGLITRVAGTGVRGAQGLGGEPAQAQLNRPHGVTVAPGGTLYIVDTYNDRLLKIVR